MTEKERQDLITSLNQILADTAVLKQKVHAYHWTVRGLLFSQLHEFFMDIYEELEEAFDEIGEQVRILDEDPALQLSEYAGRSVIDEADPDANLSAVDMIQTLHDDNERIITVLKKAEEIANEADGAPDSQGATAEAVLDFIVERHRQHDEYRYLLRSHIEQFNEQPTTE